METIVERAAVALPPPSLEAETPVDRYWRNVLKGQRLFRQAEIQQHMSRAGRETLTERRGGVRATLDQTRAAAATALQEAEAPPPLSPREEAAAKEAMAILIRGVIRWANEQIAAQNETSESIDPFAETADAA